jgi:hypothetical protein
MSPVNSSLDFLLAGSVVIFCTNDVVLMLISACFAQISYVTVCTIDYHCFLVTWRHCDASELHFAD